MRLRLISRRAALVCGAAFFLASPAAAEEVRVMTSGGTAAAFVALAPEFERATGHTVVTLATLLRTNTPPCVLPMDLTR